MPLNDQRAVANVRERKRTQKLNQAYKQLQSIIPKEPSDKMSKIHTLKLALSYIDFLNNLLKEDGDDASLSTLDGCGSRQHLKSPCASNSSSASNYAHLSSTSEEEEEYQHRCKRARVEYQTDDLHHRSIPTSQYESSQVTTCYTTLGNHIPAQSSYNRQQGYSSGGSHLSPAPSDTTITNTYYVNHTPPTQMSNIDPTVDLRNAFREFRTGKRKHFA